MTYTQHQPAREKASQMGVTADWQPWRLASVYECTRKRCTILCVRVCVWYTAVQRKDFYSIL